MNKYPKALMALFTALLLVMGAGGGLVRGAKASDGVATARETAEKTEPEFYDPNLSNRYTGRLQSFNSKYPLERMKELCEPFTGVDTAQVKCRSSSAGSFICEYKCSLHWMTTDR